MAIFTSDTFLRLQLFPKNSWHYNHYHRWLKWWNWGKRYLHVTWVSIAINLTRMWSWKWSMCSKSRALHSVESIGASGSGTNGCLGTSASAVGVCANGVSVLGTDSDLPDDSESHERTIRKFIKYNQITKHMKTMSFIPITIFVFHIMFRGGIVLVNNIRLCRLGIVFFQNFPEFHVRSYSLAVNNIFVSLLFPIFEKRVLTQQFTRWWHFVFQHRHRFRIRILNDHFFPVLSPEVQLWMVFFSA